MMQTSHTHTQFVFCPSHFPTAVRGRCPARRGQRTKSTTKRHVSESAAPPSAERRRESASQPEGTS
eukprot:7988441-Alexandrium_andersonii.AAC.1